MSATKASDLFASGDLSGAIELLTQAVKRNPTDRDSRGLLAEFLCIAGEFERADKQLDTLGNQDIEAAPALAMFRQVLRAEIARREFFVEGRAPEFIGNPTPTLKKHLEASVYLRDAEVAHAAELLNEAEEMRPTIPGVCDGQAFDDWRDLDDLTAGFLEVLTTTGSYYWVPMESVESLEFTAPQRPRDLIWRRTQLAVRGGPEGEVFVPATYANPVAESSDRTRLGQMTDWQGGENAPVLGMGQRTFLVGEEARPIMQIEAATFDEDA